MAWLALLTLGESEPGRTPPGLIAVGGVPIVERQLRALRDAGAARLLLLAPALPAARAERLAQAGDILRLETPEALARALADEPRDLILLAPGLIAGPALVATLAAGGPAIACFEDRADPALPAAAERLDSASFWAGAARLPAPLVADVAARLGDWALVPTLVRSGIEAGLPRVLVAPPDGSLARLWRLAGEAEAATDAEAALLAATRPGPDGLVARHLHRPIECALAALLLPRRVPPVAAALAAPLLLAGAVALVMAGWPGWSLVPLLAAGPLAGLGRRLAVARGQTPPPAWLAAVPPALGGAWLVALAGFVAPAMGVAAWLAAAGALLLLGATLASHWAWQRATGSALRHRAALDRRLAPILAEPWLLGWLAAGLGLAGGWRWALLGVAGAAAIGFGFWHARLLSGLVAGGHAAGASGMRPA